MNITHDDHGRIKHELAELIANNFYSDEITWMQDAFTQYDYTDITSEAERKMARLKTSDDDTPHKKLLLTFDQQGVHPNDLRTAINKANRMLRDRSATGWIAANTHKQQVQLFLVIDPEPGDEK